MKDFNLKKYLKENNLLEENPQSPPFTEEEISILDSKIPSSLRGEIYGKLGDIYNTEDKKKELFNQTLNQYDDVVKDFSQLIPTTSLEKKLFTVKIGQGSRADNIGPGELFVVLSTKNTTFGSVGDINSSGVEIEIKKSTSRELNVTYTAGGIYKFFPILRSLNSLIDNIKDTLEDHKPQYKSLSPNSRLLFKYLAKGFDSLKIDPKKEFEGKPFVDSFKEYKPLFSLKREDFIDSELDTDFIDDVIKDIERKINNLQPEDFKEGFRDALSTYFGKGFDYILFYRGKEGNYTTSLFKTEDVMEGTDVDSSTIRNGYQIYIKLKQSLINEAKEEKYSSGEKLERGYGLTAKFITFIYKGLEKLLQTLK